MGIKNWVTTLDESEPTPIVSIVDIQREYHGGYLYLTLPLTEAELSDSSKDTLTQQLSDAIGLSLSSPTIAESVPTF